jgi:hypothetical protein
VSPFVRHSSAPPFPSGCAGTFTFVAAFPFFGLVPWTFCIATADAFFSYCSLFFFLSFILIRLGSPHRHPLVSLPFFPSPVSSLPPCQWAWNTAIPDTWTIYVTAPPLFIPFAALLSPVTGLQIFFRLYGLGFSGLWFWSSWEMPSYSHRAGSPPCEWGDNRGTEGSPPRPARKRTVKGTRDGSTVGSDHHGLTTWFAEERSKARPPRPARKWSLEGARDGSTVGSDHRVTTDLVSLRNGRRTPQEPRGPAWYHSGLRSGLGT